MAKKKAVKKPLNINGQEATLAEGLQYLHKRIQELEVVAVKDRKEFIEQLGKTNSMLYALREDVVSNYDENIELTGSISSQFATITEYLKKPWWERDSDIL